MSRARIVVLSLVAALSAVALAASSASATISFEWFVNGHLLGGGVNGIRTFTLNSDNHNFAISAPIDGVAILLLSNRLKANGGLIFGGRPGTNEETIEFENVTVDNPQHCVIESLPNPVVGTVRTSLLKSEIVEGQSGGVGNGEPLILFIPKTGAVFTEIRFLDAPGETCPIKNAEGALQGSILGLPLPQRTSVLRQNLVFPALTDLYLISTGGAVKLAALSVVGTGSPATLTGLTLVVLNSDESFGPF